MSEADLIERLAEAIGKRIKPALPLDVQLWNLEMIGAYLHRHAARIPEGNPFAGGQSEDGRRRGRWERQGSTPMEGIGGHRLD
jgi:hypothetical protein